MVLAVNTGASGIIFTLNLTPVASNAAHNLFVLIIPNTSVAFVVPTTITPKLR